MPYTISLLKLESDENPEPCIRGHRATSCAHTDRVLVEIRKPGRPLQSCGHRLETCVCGRLNEYFKIGDGE